MRYAFVLLIAPWIFGCDGGPPPETAEDELAVEIAARGHDKKGDSDSDSDSKRGDSDSDSDSRSCDADSDSDSDSRRKHHKRGDSDSDSDSDSGIDDAVQCLCQCAQKVSKPRTFNNERKQRRYEAKVAKKQKKCADLLARLSPEEYDAALAEAGEDYKACYACDRCDNVMAALAEGCEQFFPEPICAALLDGLGVPCIDQLCGEGDCNAQCDAFTGAALDVCLPVVGEQCFPVASAVYQVCVDVSGCPVPCGQQCDNDFNAALNGCFGPDGPDVACFEDAQNTHYRCLEGCCVDELCGGQPEPDPPGDGDLCEGDPADCQSCEDQCAMPPGPSCGDGSCEGIEPEYCPSDCEVPVPCEIGCQNMGNEALGTCFDEAGSFDQACVDQVEVEFFLCLSGCCHDVCGDGEECACCDFPPSIPTCGDGICDGAEGLDCPEDCAPQACEPGCFEARENAGCGEDDYACHQAADYQLSLCLVGCCDLGCEQLEAVLERECERACGASEAPECQDQGGTVDQCGESCQPPPEPICDNDVCDPFEEFLCPADCQQTPYCDMFPDDPGCCFESCVAANCPAGDVACQAQCEANCFGEPCEDPAECPPPDCEVDPSLCPDPGPCGGDCECVAPGECAGPDGELHPCEACGPPPPPPVP